MSDDATPAKVRLTDELGAGAGARWRYYYRVNECKAKDANAADCVCWHDEGGGPFDNARHDDAYPILEWREAPNAK